MQGKFLKLALICALLVPQWAQGQNILRFLSECVGRVLGSAPSPTRRPASAPYIPGDFDFVYMTSHYHPIWHDLAVRQAEIANQIANFFPEGGLPARNALTLAGEDLASLVREENLDQVIRHRHFGEYRDFEASSVFSVDSFPYFWLTAERSIDISREQALALEYRILAEVRHVEARDPQGRNTLQIADEVARSMWMGRMTFYKHSRTGNYLPAGYAFRTRRPADEDLVFLLMTEPHQIDPIFDDVCYRLDALARGERALTPAQIEEEWAHALYGFLQTEYYAAGNHEIGMAAFAGFYKAVMGRRLDSLMTPGQAIEAMTRGERRFVAYVLDHIHAR